MYPIDLIRHESPELFIALVAPVGADTGKVCEFLAETLARFDYRLETIKVIEQLKRFSGYLEKEPTNEFQKINGRMDAGDDFREKAKRNDALALLALSHIREFRKQAGGEDKPLSRQAYLFRSLKRPEEVKALRRIYGSNLIVIAAHSSREQRIVNLAHRIAQSEYSAQSDRYRAFAEKLVLRDEYDETKRFGQKLRDAFALGDVFVNAEDPQDLQYHMNRFFDLLFGRPVITPTRDEAGMAHAYLAAMRSAEMGRQVGAAICDPDGYLVSIGTNEVPKAHGGSYWDGDSPDGRDWVLGYDSSDRFKTSSLGELLKTFVDSNFLSKELTALSIPELVKKIRPSLKQTRYMQLIEFVRAVHGEMSAITNAAARGVPVKDCVLFVTAFPCHECARHIVAAGINRVVYIEPYAKSLAIELHGDSIQLDSTNEASKIPFVPFLGVAPRNYANMFESPKRKDEEGNLISWNPLRSHPRVSGSFWSYLKYEIEDIGFLATDLEKNTSKLV